MKKQYTTNSNGSRIRVSPMRPWPGKSDRRKVLAERRIDRLASQIKKWQTERDITNEQAAELIGVPIRTYGDWKGGQHAPRGFALKQLREKLEGK